MIKRIALVMVLMPISLASFSQNISVSPYSVYGVGLITDKSSALNRSTGTGIAVRDPNNLNNYNPAAYTSPQGVTQIFEIGFYTESNSYRTSKESGKSNAGNLSGINAWFRFSKNWAGVIGLSPYSKVNYNILSTRKIGIDGGSSETFTGSGGITQFYFGNAYQITKRLSLGVDGSYLFGSINKVESIISGYGGGIALHNKIVANRLKVDFGAQYSIPLQKSRSLTFGLVFTPQVRLNTTAKRMLVRSLEGDTIVQENINLNDYVLPRSFGAGVSFQTNRSTVAFEAQHQQWSKATLEDNVKLRNTSRMSFSYTYEGNPNGEKYWDFVQLKTGFHIQNNYLVLEKGSFNEWGFLAGVGFPVRGNLGTVSLSYHYNRSGTIMNGLIEQRSNTIVIDFVFRDLWGIKRKFD